MKMSPNEACPCGSKQKYKKCCRVLHNGAPAPTPEALMRARYTAYALGRVDYVMQTTHPDSEHYRADAVVWKRELEAFSGGTRFEKLDILATEGDTVTFRATLLANRQNVSFTERSLFSQHEGRWVYMSGEAQN